SMLNYRHSQPLAANDWTGFRLVEAHEQTNYPISLCVDDLGEQFGLAMHTVPSIASTRVLAFVETTLSDLVHALDGSPHQPATTLDVIPQAERRQLLEGFNDTRRDYPNSVLLHELFEQQVRLRPDAPAACFEAGQLSYDALNRRANQLARHLRELGVGPDTLVAICAERSLEMVVALLAVLKAGGAYVPLDPAYPPERLHYMLQDAQPRVLLTQHALRERLPDTDAPVFTLDLDWHHIAHL
ncbi:AMP-binding protein, partial [Burkholderia ubonensis]|uniref:AMP-binding protein n=1 Tax=Burkholderia ubonensis TaxID=101571 RepID=UPI0018E15ADA